jgi:hypothetical protein
MKDVLSQWGVGVLLAKKEAGETPALQCFFTLMSAHIYRVEPV